MIKKKKKGKNKKKIEIARKSNKYFCSSNFTQIWKKKKRKKKKSDVLSLNDRKDIAIMP